MGRAKVRIGCLLQAGLGLFVLAGFNGPATARAEEPQVHEHETLAVDVSLTLGEVIDRTVENDPGYVELGARQEQADAWQDRGASWFAGQPVVSLRYQTDRWGDDLGLQEIESGIQLALWKWGERRSARDLGRSLQAEAEAAAPALRWEIAGLMRRLLWEIARAEAKLELIEESEAIAERLTGSVERRYELGDVAQRDVLLARSARLAATARVAEARVVLTDAERTYRTVTGLDRRPEIGPEPLSSGDRIDTSHPALLAAAAAVERSQAARDLALETGTVSPTLSIGPRRERAVSTQPYEDSIGINVTVPFGGGSHIRTGVAAAGREVAATEARLRATARKLDLAMHEAAHSLVAARNNVALAGERMALASQGYKMGEVAYSRGEIGLVELLNLRDVYLDAKLQAIRFEIEVNLQTALYNQAVGVIP